MKYRKMSLLVGLVAVMIAVLAGCRSEKKAKTVKGSMSEMLADIAAMDSGEITGKYGENMIADTCFTIRFNWPDNAASISTYTQYIFREDDENAETYKKANEAFAENPTELFVFKDGKLYYNIGINLNAHMVRKQLKESTASVVALNRNTYGAKWIEIPLPQALNGEKLKKLFGRMIAACGNVAELGDKAGTDGDYTFSVQADREIDFTKSVRDWEAANLKEIFTAVFDDLSEIDWKEYLKTLYNFYESDLREILRDHGGELGLTEKQLDDFKEILGTDVAAETLYQYITLMLFHVDRKDQSAMKSAATRAEELRDAILKETDITIENMQDPYREEKRYTTKFEARLQAKKENYSFTMTEEVKEDGTYRSKITADVTPGKVSISAPDEVVTLRWAVDELYR